MRDISTLKCSLITQWRSNYKICRPVCNAHGPGAVGGPKFVRRCFFGNSFEYLFLLTVNTGLSIYTCMSLFADVGGPEMIAAQLSYAEARP